MTYEPSPEWLDLTDQDTHHPVYFARIEDVAEDWSTGPVLAPTRTKIEGLQLPRASAISIDLIDGKRTPQKTVIELVDLDGLATQLVDTEWPGAQVPTLKNRGITIFGGYASMNEADYPPIWFGRIISVKRKPDAPVYEFSLVDQSYLLDGVFGKNASDIAPATIVGNVVNVWRALMTGVFNDPNFPLRSFSENPISPGAGGDAASSFDDPELARDGDPNTFATGSSEQVLVCAFDPASGSGSGRFTVDLTVTSGTVTVGLSFDGGATQEILDETSSRDRTTVVSSVYFDRVLAGAQLIVTCGLEATCRVYECELSSVPPTGLDIPAASIDDVALQEERDNWHPDTLISVIFNAEIGARNWLEREINRPFLAFHAIRGDGLLSLKFVRPPVRRPDFVSITEDEVLGVGEWTRAWEDHLNRFEFFGDWNPDDSSVIALYDEITADDLADQSNTGEEILWQCDSQTVQSLQNGDVVAEDVVGRLRIIYQRMPVLLPIAVSFRRRNIEVGDTVALTLRNVPRLGTGTLDLDQDTFFVLSITPNYDRGTMDLLLLDVPFRKYGSIAPDATPDHDTATDEQKSLYVFLANLSTELLGDGSPPYRYL